MLGTLSRSFSFIQQLLGLRLLVDMVCQISFFTIDSGFVNRLMLSALRCCFPLGTVGNIASFEAREFLPSLLLFLCLKSTNTSAIYTKHDTIVSSMFFEGSRSRE